MAFYIVCNLYVPYCPYSVLCKPHDFSSDILLCSHAIINIMYLAILLVEGTKIFCFQLDSFCSLLNNRTGELNILHSCVTSALVL